jgi:hypothetical protein
MIPIHPHNTRLYAEWLALALQDASVYPFLSGDQTLNTHINIVDEWSEAHFISGGAFTSLYFNRRRFSAIVKLHVVETESPLQKKGDGQHAMRFLFSRDYVFDRFGLSWIDFSVHETNADMLALLGKRLKPWGIEPNGLFDRNKNQWVAGHKFRIARGDVEKNCPALFR